jgi:nucleotide-binding universal stress UspA family protein
MSYYVLIIDMAHYDAEEEQTVGGFETFEAAKAYARDFVRRSVEDLRAPNQSAEDLRRLWHHFGEDAVVVGGEERYAGWHDLAVFIERPETNAGQTQ